MKRKISISIIVVLILCIGLLIYINRDIDSEQLKGSILVGELQEKNNYVTFILDLETNSRTYIDTSIAKGSSFAGDNNHLIHSVENKIYIYDIKSNTNTLICEVPYDGIIGMAKYINKDTVSFLVENKLVLFNFKSKKEEIVTFQLSGNEYSYCSQNNKLYYSESRKIYEFDLGTKVKKYIGDGHNPIISRKGNVMGYMIHDDNLKRKNFFVKNLNTGEIWKKKYDAYSYVLSPDENFVLMRKEGRGFGFFVLYLNNSKETIICDYKNDREFEIMDHGSYDFVLDWI